MGTETARGLEIRRARPDDAAAIRTVQAETWLATYPNEDVYLNVAAYNEHAKRFYARHGFVFTGEAGHDPAATIGDVVMPELEIVRRGVRLAGDE